MSELKRIVLELDADDHKTVTEFFANYGKFSDGELMLPEGDSNDEGAMVAEAIRGLQEYRAMVAANNPSK